MKFCSRSGLFFCCVSRAYVVELEQDLFGLRVAGELIEAHEVLDHFVLVCGRAGFEVAQRDDGCEDLLQLADFDHSVDLVDLAQQLIRSQALELRGASGSRLDSLKEALCSDLQVCLWGEEVLGFSDPECEQLDDCLVDCVRESYSFG